VPFYYLRLKFSRTQSGRTNPLPIENRRLPAAVLQKCDAGQNEDHGKVAKRVNLVAREEDTDNERHAHAGLNTVLESLAQGVPQLAIPITYDQPGVAARIAHKKSRRSYLIRQSTADHLASLLNEVLTDPTYRENARKLQKAITEANGLSVAADLIEESLGMSRKISAAAA
jgi:hypothetical protein